jgi:hypothetical protein
MPNYIGSGVGAMKKSEYNTLVEEQCNASGDKTMFKLWVGFLMFERNYQQKKLYMGYSCC